MRLTSFKKDKSVLYSFDKVDMWFGENPQSVEVSNGRTGDTRVALQRAKACMELVEHGCPCPLEVRQQFQACVRGAKTDADFDKCGAQVSCEAEPESNEAPAEPAEPSRPSLHPAPPGAPHASPVVPQRRRSRPRTPASRRRQRRRTSTPEDAAVASWPALICGAGVGDASVGQRDARLGRGADPLEADEVPVVVALAVGAARARSAGTNGPGIHSARRTAKGAHRQHRQKHPRTHGSKRTPVAERAGSVLPAARRSR